MDQRNSYNVLYWNANSLQNKIFLLYDFLRDKDIDIACICETFLSPNDILHTDGDFIMHRLDRDSPNRSGGVAIIIKRNLKHILLPRPHTRLMEALSIDVITTTNSKIRFTSAYLPGGATTAQINDHYKNDIRILTSPSIPYYICADWNSKHRLYAPTGTVEPIELAKFYTMNNVIATSSSFTQMNQLTTHLSQIHYHPQ